MANMDRILVIFTSLEEDPTILDTPTRPKTPPASLATGRIWLLFLLSVLIHAVFIAGLRPVHHNPLESQRGRRISFERGGNARLHRLTPMHTSIPRDVVQALYDLDTDGVPPIQNSTPRFYPITKHEYYATLAGLTIRIGTAEQEGDEDD